jgi:prolyl-tRNA synthetase
MVHGDDRGLNLPPNVAPTQLVIIPIGPAKTREMVNAKADEIFSTLKRAGVRVKMDDNPDASPGWKFNEYEMRGVPIRLEIGPRDIENGQAVLVARATGEKRFVKLENLESEVQQFISDIQTAMLEQARQFMQENFSSVETLAEMKVKMEESRGFNLAGWCGSADCESTVKDETGATSRNIPFEVAEHKENCLVCGEKAKHTVVFARAY